MGKLIASQEQVTVEQVKKNCWEFKKCGRQPGGARAEELGICPVTIHGDLNGAHGGSNAGRACWVVAGSLCGGTIQGTFAQKLLNCWSCDFMKTVKQEEEPSTFGFSHTRLGMERTIEKQRGEMIDSFTASCQQEKAEV